MCPRGRPRSQGPPRGFHLWILQQIFVNYRITLFFFLTKTLLQIIPKISTLVDNLIKSLKFPFLERRHDL